MRNVLLRHAWLAYTMRRAQTRGESGRMTESLEDYQDEIQQGLLSLFGAWSEHIEVLEQVIDGPVSLVRARTMNGSIVVRGGSQTYVTVKAWKVVRGPVEGLAEIFAERVAVDVERHGETVALYAVYPGLPLGCRVFVRYEIGVPRDVDVDLYTHNGGINVLGVEGAIEAETWSGNIELEDTMGPAKLYTSNGAIRMTGLDGAVEAESGKGGVQLESSSGRAQLRTTNGDIMVVSSDAAVKAQSYSGDIEVQQGRGRAELQTVNGDVRASFADLSGERRSVTVTAVTQTGSLSLDLAGGSAIIDAEATDGSISLDLPSDFAGYLEAGTRRGAVVCELSLTTGLRTLNLLAGQLGEGGAGSVRVQTFDGDIRIRAREDPHGATTSRDDAA